jgi:hypothetical protein
MSVQKSYSSAIQGNSSDRVRNREDPAGVEERWKFGDHAQRVWKLGHRFDPENYGHSDESEVEPRNQVVAINTVRVLMLVTLVG